MNDWSKTVVYPQDNDAYEESVLEIDHSSLTAGSQLTEWQNQIIIGGFSTSPNYTGQTFLVPERQKARLLDKIVVEISRIGNPQGFLQMGLYNYSTRVFALNPNFTEIVLNPITGPLARSIQIQSEDIPTNGIYGLVEFSFEEDFALEPGSSLCFILRFIGISDPSETYFKVGIVDSDGSLPADEEYPNGVGFDSFWSSSTYFNEDWAEDLTGLLNISMDLAFQVYSRTAQTYIPETSWTKPTPPSSTWQEEPTLPSSDWNRFASFDDFYTRGRLNLLGRARVLREFRTSVKAAREFVALSEEASEAQGATLSESLELLERAEVVQIPRFFQVENSEALLLLERGQVFVDSRNVTFIGREFIEIAEDIVLAFSLSIQEDLLLLERAEVLKSSRSQTKASREFIRITEQPSFDARVAITFEELLKLLERGQVIKESRAFVKSGREFIGMSEMLEQDTPLPVIESAQINASQDINPSNDSIRCRFFTGVNCQSVRIQRRVNGGSLTFHQDMNVSPNSGPILSSFYGGNPTEIVFFRITPFSASGQTGIQGLPVNTNAEQIPADGGGGV